MILQAPPKINGQGPGSQLPFFFNRKIYEIFFYSVRVQQDFTTNYGSEHWLRWIIWNNNKTRLFYISLAWHHAMSFTFLI